MVTALKPVGSKSLEDGILDKVMERLSRELRLPQVQKRSTIELQGGVYVVSREPSRLSYEDKVATAHFNESNPPTLDYHVSASYLEGQLHLLKSTETSVGERLLLQLAAIDRKQTRPLSESEKSMLQRAGQDTGGPALLIAHYVPLEIPDFGEVYQFVKRHILYR